MRRKITSHVNIWVPSMVKWTKKMLQFTKTIIFLVKGLKVVAKRCLNWISLRANLCYCVWILKCRKSSWDLKYASLKVMLKSKWLSLVLDIDFMTLTILKLEFSFIFLEFVIYLRASWQDFVGIPLFLCFLFYFEQILDNHLFDITYFAQHLLKYVEFSWIYFIIIIWLAL